MNTMAAKRLLGGLLALVCAMGCLWTGIPVFAEETEPTDVPAAVEGDTSEPEAETPADETTATDSYFAYYQQHEGMVRPANMIRIDALTYRAAENEASAKGEADGKAAALLNTSNNWMEWNFSVPEDGLYAITPTYYPLEGTGKEILLNVQLDGQNAFTESSSLSLPRIWMDENVGAEWEKDASGSDKRPQQVESPRWVDDIAFYEPLGLYTEPYLFYLTAGDHVLRMERKRETVALQSIAIGNEPAPVSYLEYHATHTREDLATGDVVLLQAEKALEKTSSTLYPVYDRSSVATIPNDPYAIRLNTIGQSNWNSMGQSITWKVSVPQDGLYRIAFRARQNTNTGMISYRTLRINGEIPFQEAIDIPFAYSDEWQMVTLGGDQSIYVYLHDGDTITLDCTAGKMSHVLREVQQTVLELNTLYRQIIVITGSSPDVYNDYYLEKKIPGLIEKLQTCSDKLHAIADEMYAINGKSGSQISTVRVAADGLKEMAAAPYNIPARLGTFRGNTETLGSLLNSLGQQPLELDYIAFVPSGEKVPSANASFWNSLVFNVKKFVASFMNDYDSGMSGAADGEALQVWVATGRDQVQVLKNMVDDTFTPTYNLPVEISLVDTGDNLIKATLAGKGPDVALMIGKEFPVNLAMRGMLTDLNDFDLGDLLEEFQPSALASFYFNGGLYALPETEIFDMIFYRTDIFEELGLEPPDTWDDLYRIIKVLQESNLEIGIPEINSANKGVSSGISTFDKFLFQSGGTYFNEGLNATLFETDTSIQAFEKWVELYQRYSLDREFDFFNRFRSGVMPIGIAGYTTYNQLVYAAPELRGLWAMAPIPGTVQEDGTVNRSESTAVTGCMVIKSAVQRGVGQQAVDFISWWAGSESQSRYAQELESILGVSARYAPANTKAFSAIGWSDEEAAVIRDQWEWTYNVPQIPGNYVIPRSLTSAFRSALDRTNTPSRALAIYNKNINDEIARKRRDYNLD